MWEMEMLTYNYSGSINVVGRIFNNIFKRLTQFQTIANMLALPNLDIINEKIWFNLIWLKVHYKYRII